jgi:hypothetical protein
MRLALLISNKHRRTCGFGRVLVALSLNECGLVSLYEIVAPGWEALAGKPNAGGERRR